MKNKKAAMSINVLIIIIVVLVTSTILLFFVAKLSSTTSEMADLQACRNSIILAAKTRQIQGKPLTNLDCKRSELVFRKKEVIEGGEVNQGKVGQILVEAMADCWYMFGEGKVDPFSSIETAGSTFCLVCKEVVFDDALKEYLEDKRESSDYDWIKHELIKTPNYNDIIPNTDMTYSQYFNHAPKLSILEYPDQAPIDSIILKDGSLLGISSLKLKSTQECAIKPDFVDQIGFLVRGDGDDKETIISSLFIAPPSNLRSYDWSGGLIIKDRDGFFESAAKTVGEGLLELPPVQIVKWVVIDGICECLLGLLDSVPNPTPLCQITIN
jgi:hypothetical protein